MGSVICQHCLNRLLDNGLVNIYGLRGRDKPTLAIDDDLKLIWPKGMNKFGYWKEGFPKKSEIGQRMQESQQQVPTS